MLTNRLFYSFNRKDCLVFILGLFSMIKIQLLGTFGISELIMVLLLFKIKDNSFFLNPKAKLIFSYAILWALGITLSDLYNVSTVLNSLKGLVSVILLILVLPVAYWSLADNPIRILYYILGLSLSSILNFYFQTADSLDEVGTDVWQVYAFKFLAIALASTYFFYGKRKSGYTILVGYGLWSLFHSSRNIFVIFILSSVIIAFIYFIYDKNCSTYNDQKMFNNRLIPLSIILLTTFVGIKGSYEFLASSGILGEDARNKYIMQKNSSIGLASGRSDFFIAWEMIKKSPIIGYGSYAKDRHEEAYKAAVKLGIEDGSSYSQSKVMNKFIPGHSHILGAWVYNGILSIFFWLYTLYLIVLFFRKSLFYDIQITPLMVIWCISSIWTILFSPFANRPILAFFISSILVILRKNDHNEYLN